MVLTLILCVQTISSNMYTFSLPDEFLWNFSIISFLLHLFKILTNIISMALGCNSSPSSSSSPSWMSFLSPIFIPKGVALASEDLVTENSRRETSTIIPLDDLASKSLVSISKGLSIMSEESHKEMLSSEMYFERNTQKELGVRHQELVVNGTCFDSKVYLAPTGEVKVRKRPAKIVIPESCLGLDFGAVGGELHQKEFEVEGRDFFLASRKGRREVMEDGHGIVADIMGDSKQAFFGVFDGHGGHEASDYVSENLGRNIITAIGEVENAEDQLEKATREGYLTTDKEFLSKAVSSGACAATVLLKNGKLCVANVGDCRVVLSRKGVADALTSDHRVNREDERYRIESSGGYVSCRNGVWRVQGSLAVSRAIGDLHLKEWIISEPEIKKLPLTSDCEFLIMATDGLWDKVTNQEAVDVVLRHKKSIESCRKLVDISSGRGNKDDITVMVVYLQNFKTQG